jgi:hypothetical protein
VLSNEWPWDWRSADPRVHRSLWRVFLWRTAASQSFGWPGCGRMLTNCHSEMARAVYVRQVRTALDKGCKSTHAMLKNKPEHFYRKQNLWDFCCFEYLPRFSMMEGKLHREFSLLNTNVACLTGLRTFLVHPDSGFFFCIIQIPKSVPVDNPFSLLHTFAVFIDLNGDLQAHVHVL